MQTNIVILSEEPLAGQLISCRVNMGASRAEAAAKTKVPEKYLTLFEDGRYAELADDVYTTIYLKGYAAYLGLPSKDVLARYRIERIIAAKTPDRLHPTASVPRSHLVVAPTIIRNVIIALAVCALAVYFGVEVTKIVAPPSISLTSPQDGLFTIEHLVAVAGKTQPGVELRINGKTLAPDTQGNFSDEFAVQQGMNIITIAAKKKYSKARVETRRVIVVPPEPIAPVIAEPTPSTTDQTQPVTSAAVLPE